MDNKIKERLLSLDQDVFHKVMFAKKRVNEKLRDSRPDDESSLEELADYFEKLSVFTQLLQIHKQRENFKPNGLVWFNDGTEYHRIERICDMWDGDPEYVCCGDFPEYEGGIEELISLTPENFQGMVNFHPEHYLGVYKALDLHKEPGYENIEFPDELQEVRSVILDLKDLGV